VRLRALAALVPHPHGAQAVTGPNGAGDREPAGVFARVRRDRQVSNLLYGLLGAEDERNPRRALESLATSAAETLDVCGPEYRVRVVRALQLLTGLVLDAAENAVPPVEQIERALALDELDAGPRIEDGPLIDPDCAAGKHGSCVGGPCECDCHPEPGSGKSAGQQYLQNLVIHDGPVAACPICGGTDGDHNLKNGPHQAADALAAEQGLHPIGSAIPCPTCSVINGHAPGCADAD
jgi:hypothetical protein